MSQSLTDLEPRFLWGHFAAICGIPHPSKHEEAIRAHVLAWAKERGFASEQDAAGSIVVRVPATPGHEGAPTVVLQGHLDMVGEANSDVTFDFDKDPIDAYVDGEWVTARGTTLGADNGIGLAAAMAAAEDPEVIHAPLELLFTVDEETGLTGASQLQAGFVTGGRLLNLDSEEDGTLYVGCAGGGDSTVTVPVTRAPAPEGSVGLRVNVSGLKGGHSGLDIIENRGNAVKLLTRALRGIRAVTELNVVTLHGGDKHNAIPREAWADILVPKGGVDAAKAAVAQAAGVAAEEFGAIEKGLTMGVAEHEVDTLAFVFDSRDRVLDLLLALPHGVLSMSRDLAGLVETSSNVASVRTAERAVTILNSTRSSSAAALGEVREQIRACAALAGASAELEPGYPGWQPNMDSELLATAQAVYQQRYGKTASVAAIHAGLECGILGERCPGIDMLSFGPEIQGAHSPDERVSIPSTARFWDFLKDLLAKLA